MASLALSALKYNLEIQPKPRIFPIGCLRTPILPPPSRSRLNQRRLLTSSAASRLLRLSVSSNGEYNVNRERSNDSKLFINVPASPLNRSLSTSSSCDDVSLFREARASFSLPPVAPNSKVQGETKKQKKSLGQQADRHSLKLFHNRHLQWRFANANAEIKTQSLKTQAERMFYTLGLKMTAMYDSVQKKRIEFQALLRLKVVTEIVNSQIPSLEQWNVIEEDYLTSLSEVTKTLSNASLRLPVDDNIKVESKELAKVLADASKSMEGIAQNIGNFVPKTQEMETLMSGLARVSNN